MTLFWRSLAALFVIIALVGVVVPGLPTTPFLLLAVWASAKAWPRLHQWLMTHPVLGVHIQNWHTHRKIPLSAKLLASIMLLISAVSIFYTVPIMALKVAVNTLLLLVFCWLWFWVN